MRVLLLQDVPGIGKRGSLVTVQNGHARNFLIPKKIALIATPGIIEKQRREETRLQSERAALESSLLALSEKLPRVSITIPAKANEAGHLFGSIHHKEILEVLAKQGVTLKPAHLTLETPIDHVGDYTIPVNLNSNLRTHFMLTVVRAYEK